MGILSSLFGKSNEKKQPVGAVSHDSREKTLKSIFPYFKQLLPPAGVAEALPDDLKRVDSSKTYEHPSIKPVIREVCEDLNCLYAIDNEYGYEIIQEDTLTGLAIDREQLHAIALENYRQLLSKNMKAHGDANGILFTVDGNLEAGLVLIDEIWDQMEEKIGEEVVVAVPARDVVVATGRSNRSMIDTFNQKARNILNGGDHPLSGNWFVRKNRKWEVFEPIP